MRVLFVHQNFPGQFRHLALHWAANPNNQVVSIGQKQAPGLNGIPRVQYEPTRAVTPSIHHYISGAESGVLNGQGVARACIALKQRGFVPDIVFGHAGWGETLYMHDVFPGVPLVNYFEFFYHAAGADTGFDPEYPNAFDDIMRIRTKNAINLLSLDGCDAGISPTQWQKSVYPKVYQDMISVIHEGVSTDRVTPDPGARLTLADGRTLGPEDEVVTYVARNLEPYRGFHVFMRAVQEICRRRPKCQVLVVGGDGVSYGRKLESGQTYRQKMLEEVEIDPQRVHFLGQIPYDKYLTVLHVSSAHVYLTVPFVLSWSMLEAMSAGCLVIGSNTAPVLEVLEHEINGLVVDFFSPAAIADAVDEALDNREKMTVLRERAREFVIENYTVRRSLTQYRELVEKMGVKVEQAFSARFPS